MAQVLTDISNNSIIVEQNKVAEELNKIGITQNILIDACKTGLLSKANCTSFDTKGQAGYIQWNDTNSKLRLLTNNKGWEKYQENGIEGIISIDKTIRIIPSSGNAATGNPNQTASNKNPKGESCIKLIDKTCQGNIFTGYSEPEEEKFETYILLYYANSKELRMELSKPSSIDKQGKINAWDKRLILEKQFLNDLEVILKENSEEETIDIPVIRKQSEG